MVASLRLVKSLARCLCCISNVFLVIQSIEKCSSVSFHCLHNVEEVKSFVLLIVKSPLVKSCLNGFWQEKGMTSIAGSCRPVGFPLKISRCFFLLFLDIFTQTDL